MTAVLNPAQREAIRCLDGPCLVIAGAGSGKTRVITQKILHLVESGFAPEAIAAITFTNKAANEMAERLAQMSRFAPGRRPTVSTFHSLGLQILRRDGESIGLKRNFSILDADDSQGILAGALATTTVCPPRLRSIGFRCSGRAEPSKYNAPSGPIARGVPVNAGYGAAPVSNCPLSRIGSSRFAVTPAGRPSAITRILTPVSKFV